MECSKDGCISPVFAKGLCCSHYDEYKLENAPVCIVDGCNDKAHAKQLCNKHYRQQLQKGKEPCRVNGCNRPVHTNGLCTTHHTRQRRHGHLDPTRPHDWGGREKHPAYNAWTTMKKKRGSIFIEKSWLDDFWDFVKDVGEKPNPNSRLNIRMESQGYRKGNVYWRKPLLTKDKAEKRSEYQRRYIAKMRENDPERFAEYDFRRKYGITLKEYNLLLESQNSKCAICGNGESVIHWATSKIQKLAVDHCHETGKVRGLLCTNCNNMLGKAKDSKDILLKAIEYLEKNEAS